MEKNQVLTLVLVPLLFLSLAPTGTNFLIASTSEEEEASSSGLPFTTQETTTSAPPAAATTTPPSPAEALGEDFVRARLMLFGVQPNSPNIVAWINVPGANATTADSISSTELDATNNITGDGIGELFLSLPNATSQINQQIEACALDVQNQIPVCDDAFQATTNASTVLQIMMAAAEEQQ